MVCGIEDQLLLRRQYFAVFLTKLTHTQVAQTYNLMRTLVAGFCFAVPFGLVRQMVLDSWKKEKPALLGGCSCPGQVCLWLEICIMW